MIVESIDLIQKHDDGIGITEWEIGIFEYLSEEIGEVLRTRELIESLTIEICLILIREFCIEEPRPCILLIVSDEKTRIIPELTTHTILIIHELVDESIRDLIDLTLWIWDLPDEDISTGVDTIFCSGGEHFD